MRLSKVGSMRARDEYARAVSALVVTLTQAHAAATDPGDEARLRGLVQRARRELNAVDEKLLMLDRRRQRSMFRRAAHLRDRLDDLHYRLACYYIERTFDDESGRCQTDQQSPGT